MRWQRAAREVRRIHSPVVEEAEIWADDDADDDHDGRFPECPGSGACEGHDVSIEVCRECGYEHDDVGPRFRRWPCPTVAALDELRTSQTWLKWTYLAPIALGLVLARAEFGWRVLAYEGILGVCCVAAGVVWERYG